MARTTTNSSSRVGGSTRLTELQSYYKNEENIWDIGCDHGLLGSSFKDHENIHSIHLVDPSLPVINKLKDSYISVPKIKIHHKQGQNLFIESKSNLIFIAGMGGKEIGEIISSLHSQLDSTSRFVISPHRKILELRSLLNTLPISLLSERVVEENGQFYQILELSLSSNGTKVPQYGDEIWKSETGLRYLKHQMLHFSSHKDLASQEYVSFLKARNP